MARSVGLPDATGFDVTKSVGRVEFSKDGSRGGPYQAALRLIGNDGGEGHYSFPHVDGGTVHVIIEIERPAPAEVV